MRVIVADDVLLVRTGLARLLSESGITVVGEADDAESAIRLVALEGPDAAVLDIRMPPTHRDEGLVAARQIRELYPATAVLVLSQYVQPRYAQLLLAENPAGLGYLLKQRVTDAGVLLDALARVTAGECVVDPSIVERMLTQERRESPLTDLTPRERQTLGLMAQGRSNAAIATELGISERTVESLCAQLFRKLDIEPDRDVNRRVLAVLTLLRR